MNTRESFVLLCGVVLSMLVSWPTSVCAQDNKVPKNSGSQGSATVVLPTWGKLQAGYTYDAKKAPTVKEVDRSDEKVYRLHVELTGLDGEKVPGTFVRPRAPGVYPVVLLLHGLTSDKETMLLFFGQALVAKGIAVLALDAPYHGERKDPAVQPSQPTVFPEVMRQGIKEWRRGLDYLATRKDVDMKKVGLLGYSMGSMMGSILSGLDNRVGAIVLCVGGDPLLPLAPSLPVEGRLALFEVCSSLYIGHAAPHPILMLNGKQDNLITEEASRRLYAAAQEPKQQIWYESGHILPMDAAQKGVGWLTEKLKKP